MSSEELREKFLKFFESKEHKIVPSSSLLPADPSVLLTTAGMQQFKPYYTGQESPFGKNVASCQKCFRTSDIDEVGDERHLTFFEMLGNFSFGGYFKEEAIKYSKDFLDSINVKIDYVTVFEGDENTPKDEESIRLWKELGFSEKMGNLKLCGKEDNFWGPTGEEGPCGPTTEIYASGIEIWNIVFNQYYSKDKKLTPLRVPGIDTGMGLERLAMVSQNKQNVFETDLFDFTKVENRAERIVADHAKSAVFLIGDRILPSNVEQGYILRRILRRAIRYGKILKLDKNFLISLAEKIILKYQKIYPELLSRQSEILTVIQKEQEKFEATLERGLKEFEKLEEITGEQAFNLYQSYGFPLELTEELAKEKGIKINKEDFKKAFEKHQEISKAGAEAKFGGVGERDNYESAKLHTATHLLHQALRQVLGNHVKQMGSDITPKRLRFDFSHTARMAEEEKNKVEDLVNEQIKKDLEIRKEEMSYEDAIKAGALAFFKEKYPERVSVYSIGNFSKEICAGPHAKRAGELGHFKIQKEESSGAGIRRIRAILE